MGVLATRVLLFGVFIGATDFWKLPCSFLVYVYSHPEVDKICGIYGYTRVLSEIVFYLLQDGCIQVRSSYE